MIRRGLLDSCSVWRCLGGKQRKRNARRVGGWVRVWKVVWWCGRACCLVGVFGVQRAERVYVGVIWQTRQGCAVRWVVVEGSWGVEVLGVVQKRKMFVAKRAEGKSRIVGDQGVG